MKKYWKIVVAVIAFVIFMVVVNVVYKNLSEDYRPQQNLVAQNTESPQEEVQDRVDAGTDESAESDVSGENSTADGQSSTESANTDNQQETNGDTTGEESDSMAIDFIVENAAGEEVTLYSFIGKPIVLNFWASWCGPCKMELPDFQAAYENYDGEIEFVMVNLTDGIQETKESATQFIEGEGYTLPFYFDTTQEAAYTYGIYSLPMTFFINAEGEIIAYAQGMIDAETLEKGISMIYP